MTIKDIEIRIETPTGQLFFPDYTTLTLSPLLNDMGGISFTAQANAKNFQYLYDQLDAGLDVPFSTYIDGVAHPELDFYVTDMDGDDIVEGSDWTFTGVTNEYRLTDAVTIPRNTIVPAEPRTYTVVVGDTLLTVMEHLYDPPLVETQYEELRANNPTIASVHGNKTSMTPYAGTVLTVPAGSSGTTTITAEARFDNATPGEIFKFYMDECTDRETLTDITYLSFNDTVDSNLIPWARTISIGVSPGLNYLDLLKALVQLQLIDFQMVGKDIRLYNYGSLSEDLTVGNDPLIFRKGRDLVDSPRKLTVRDSGNSIIMAGDNGVYSIQTDNSNVATRGRQVERYQSQGGITDQAVLDALAQQQLPLTTAPTLEKTNGLSFADKSKQPLEDFNTGDWVFTDVGNGLERYRVKQYTLSVDNNKTVTGSVTLNDLIADREQQIIESINGITQGTTILGTSTQDPATDDGKTPAAPSGLGANSLVYTKPDGTYAAIVSAVWDAVTTNDDGSFADDIDHYLVSYELTTLSAGLINFAGTPSDTSINISDLPTATNIKIYVAAVDNMGNTSVESTVTILIGHDDVAPNTPASPVCDNYLGLVRAYWNGKDSAGAAMPLDFDHIEVHWSTSSSFVPSTATLTDSFSGPGYTYKDTGGVYGSTFFCKFIAVDQAGNKSAATPSGIGAVADQVVSADILDGAVGTAKLADLAVVNAKIGNLAVNDAKIGSMSAGKITAGTMSADVIVGGRIATALSGARCLFDATGVHLYNSAGTLMVDINTSGNATFTGQFATGTTGDYIKITTDGIVHFYKTSTEVGRILPCIVQANLGFVSADAPTVVYGDELNTATKIQSNDFNGLAFSHYDTTIVIAGTPTHVVGDFVVLNATRSTSSEGSHLDMDATTTCHLGGSAIALNMEVYGTAGTATFDFYGDSSLQFGRGSPNFGPSIDLYSEGSGGIRLSAATTDFYVRFIDAFGSGAYTALKASAFTVVSTAEFKAKVTQYKDDPMAVIAATPVFKYRRKRPAGEIPERPQHPIPSTRLLKHSTKAKKSNEWIDSHESLGLVVEDAHPSLIVPGGDDGADGVDIYHMASLLWAAAQKFDQRLTELEKKS